MSKFSLFQADFNSIIGNCDAFFSQINFVHTHFGGFCSRVYVLEPLSTQFYIRKGGDGVPVSV